MGLFSSVLVGDKVEAPTGGIHGMSDEELKAKARLLYLELRCTETWFQWGIEEQKFKVGSSGGQAGTEQRERHSNAL